MACLVCIAVSRIQGLPNFVFFTLAEFLLAGKPSAMNAVKEAVAITTGSGAVLLRLIKLLCVAV
jgi:hypothetical protein